MSPDDPAETRALAHLRGLGRLLDGAVTIPGTRIRVGLDAVVGLIPVVGDWIGAGFSSYIIARSVGLGVSGATVLRMLGNLALDLIFGAVPVLGDLFDLGFRANERNLALLSAHLERPEHRRRADLKVVLGVASGLLVVVVGAVALGVWVLGLLFAALAG